jgi:hypothetical protein
VILKLPALISCVALVAVTAVVAFVALPAVTAKVAFEAKPVKLAVIVLAAKLPLESLATMVEAPFEEAAVVFAFGNTPKTTEPEAKLTPEAEPVPPEAIGRAEPKVKDVK